MPNDFRLIPGSLLEPYCFTTFQKLNVDMFSVAQVVSLLGSTFYNIGNNEPDPDKRSFPWLDTNDGQWYVWNIDVGLWVRPHQVPPSSQSRILWVGTTTDLVAYDGGDANTPGIASGPMWEVDANFAAKFPVGPGTFTAGGVVAVGGTGGNDEATIPIAALPPHQHIVPVCVRNSQTTDPPTGGSGAVASVQYGIGKSQGTGNVLDDSGGSYARSFPLTSQYNSDPPPAVDPEALPLLPPYLGAYFIKRTSRIFFVAP